MIRVLIVDDSALMRSILSTILGADPEIEVVGVASDPFVARQMIKARNPDVITLDVEMPRLNGLEFLAHLMRLRPMPVVMVSTLTQNGADKTLRALELGAVDVVAKPTTDTSSGILGLANEIVEKVKSAAVARLPGPTFLGAALVDAPTHTAQPTAPIGADHGALQYPPLPPRQVVAIGASAGGVPALTTLLGRLPVETSPVLVAQHMPSGFTRTFANRLNRICAMTVVEAENGAPLRDGHVYIAPGDRHLTLVRGHGGIACRLSDGDAVNGHRPSVDVLFHSIAETLGNAAVGVLLTGMGKDGAQGLLRMREAGASTVCQDEASSLVYGMPKAAMTIGAAEREMSLDAIPAYILANLENGLSREALQKGRR
jgi:two-component system, chemotaxis family, protein-glutamate methylesterase/glutaminase